MAQYKSDSLSEVSSTSNSNAVDFTANSQETISIAFQKLQKMLQTANCSPNSSPLIPNVTIEVSPVNLLTGNVSEINAIAEEFRSLFKIVQAENGIQLGRTDLIKLIFLYMLFSLYIHHWAHDPRMAFGKEKLNAIMVGEKWDLSLDLQAAKVLQQKLMPGIENADLNHFKNGSNQAHQQLLMINANLFDFLTNLKKSQNVGAINLDFPLSFAEAKLAISRQKAVQGRQNKANAAPSTNTQTQSHEEYFNNELQKRAKEYTASRIDNNLFIESGTGLELDFPLQFKSCPLGPNQVALTVELDGKYHYYENTTYHNPIHHIKAQSLINAGIIRIPVDVVMGVTYNQHTPQGKLFRLRSNPVLPPVTIQPNYAQYLEEHLKPQAEKIAENLNDNFVQQYYLKYYYPLITTRRVLRQRIINLQREYFACANVARKQAYHDEIEELLQLQASLSEIVNKRVMEQLIIGADLSQEFAAILKFTKDIFTLYEAQSDVNQHIINAKNEIEFINKKISECNQRYEHTVSEYEALLLTVPQIDDDKVTKEMISDLRTYLRTIATLEENQATLSKQLQQATAVLEQRQNEHSDYNEVVAQMFEDNKNLTSLADNHFNFNKITLKVSEIKVRLDQSQVYFPPIPAPASNFIDRNQNNRNRYFTSESNTNRNRDRDSSRSYQRERNNYYGKK